MSFPPLPNFGLWRSAYHFRAAVRNGAPPNKAPLARVVPLLENLARVLRFFFFGNIPSLSRAGFTNVEWASDPHSWTRSRASNSHGKTLAKRRGVNMAVFISLGARHVQANLARSIPRGYPLRQCSGHLGGFTLLTASSKIIDRCSVDHLVILVFPQQVLRLCFSSHAMPFHVGFYVAESIPVEQSYSADPRTSFFKWNEIFSKL
jgi:hypothetical protein